MKYSFARSLGRDALKLQIPRDSFHPFQCIPSNNRAVVFLYSLLNRIEWFVSKCILSYVHSSSRNWTLSHQFDKIFVKPKPIVQFDENIVGAWVDQKTDFSVNLMDIEKPRAIERSRFLLFLWKNSSIWWNFHGWDLQRFLFSRKKQGLHWKHKNSLFSHPKEITFTNQK